jgi:hypothetical protein
MSMIGQVILSSRNGYCKLSHAIVCDCNLQLIHFQLSKDFVVPNAPPSLRKADSRVLWDIHFTKLLRHSLWTPELERALENFSLGAFLDYVKRSQPFAGNVGYRDKIAPEFFNHLEANVSLPTGSQRKCQLQLIILIINQKKSDLHRTHATRYLEYAMLTINSHPPSAEKFYLLITVWVVLQKSDWWWPRDHYSLDDFERLCVTLFGFNSTDINWDRMNYRLMCYPHHISTTPSILAPICGHTAETKTLILEPILSHHLARVAISCIQYLSHGRMNTHDHLLAWAMKSKQSPWLWRQWMRVTSRRRHEPNVMLGRPYYPFPQSLRRSRQILYFEKIQTEGFRFYRMQRKFYLWTLNLLYLTLRKARKSDELTRALSKLFIPLSASLLFPRQIKRVRRAIDAYLDKVSRRKACSDSGT